MTIQNFLEMSVGKWFSQRTSHQLLSQQSEHSSSQIVIASVAADHPQLLSLCQQHQVDLSHTTGGIEVQSQAKPQWNAPKNAAVPASIISCLMPVVTSATAQTGEVLWSSNGQPMPLGKFQMGADGSLTLFLASPSMQIEERIWFASPNLRLRTSVQKSAVGWSLASFCSEIRMSV
jgi:CpeS-like protein